jgi:hypothetical protein
MSHFKEASNARQVTSEASKARQVAEASKARQVAATKQKARRQKRLTKAEAITKRTLQVWDDVKPDISKKKLSKKDSKRAEQEMDKLLLKKNSKR